MEMETLGIRRAQLATGDPAIREAEDLLARLRAPAGVPR